jgi:hypothetical protein
VLLTLLLRLARSDAIIALQAAKGLGMAQSTDRQNPPPRDTTLRIRRGGPVNPQKLAEVRRIHAKGGAQYSEKFESGSDESMRVLTIHNFMVCKEMVRGREGVDQ